MEKEKQTFWQLVFGIILTSAVTIAFGLIFVIDKSAFILGVMLGALVSILLLKHIEITMDRALRRDPKSAERYAIRNLLIRYLINIVVLICAVMLEQIDVIAVLIGLFSMKLSAFIFPYINKYVSSVKSKRL